MVLPSINIPEIRRDVLNRNLRSRRAPVFDFEKNEFANTDGTVHETSDRDTTIRQKIRAAIITERGMWPIYDLSYGSEIHKILGVGQAYVEARLPKIIAEALSREPRVGSVRIDRFEQVGDGVFIDVSVEDRLTQNIISTSVFIEGSTA